MYNEELASVRFERINNEGEHVPMKTDNLNLPPWFDADKFRKGQKYFYNNYYSMFVAKLSGLVLVLLVPSILNVLMLTGKSSTPGTAFKRYMKTISNMLDWYSGQPLKNDSNIHKVLASVRGKHCAAAKLAVTNGAAYISQRDLALTQFGFMGLAVSKNTFFGMRGSIDEIEGFIHFWRTIGYFMGIEDRFNVCDGSVQRVRDLCDEIRESVFKPLMANPSTNFTSMAEALLLGMKPVVLFLTKDAFLEFTRRVVDLPEQNPPKAFARYTLAALVYVFATVLAIRWLAAVVRPVLNVLLRFAVYSNIKLPLVAALMFGTEVLRSESAESVTCAKHQQANAFKGAARIGEKFKSFIPRVRLEV